MKQNRYCRGLEIGHSLGHMLAMYYQMKLSKQIDEGGIYCPCFIDAEREPQRHSWAQDQELANG